MDGERNLKMRVTVLAFIVLGLVSRATATDVHWTGAAVDSNSWCEPNNWAGAVVPGGADNAVINVLGGPNAEIEPDCNAMCNRLTVGHTTGNCRLDIVGGNLVVTTDFVIGEQNGGNGTVTITAGSVDVSGRLDIAPDGNGHMQLDGGTVNAGELIMDTNASMDITGGTLIIDGYALEDVWAYVDAGYLTGYGSAKGVVAHFDQSNPYKTRVTGNADYDLDQAWNPRPYDGAVHVPSPVTLQWDSGACMNDRGRHVVYSGTDADGVANASPGDAEWQGTVPGRNDPPTWNVGSLASGTTFYWRIDEQCETGTTKGKVWAFTTRVIFVDWSASGANNGTSWEDAYGYLQDALSDPNLALRGGAVWVAAGSYYPDADTANPGGTGLRGDAFELISGVRIYGGFAGGEMCLDQRDWASNQTILSGDIGTADTNGDKSYHVVIGSGTDVNAVLDGFTITAGNANGGGWNNSGGGMYNMGGSPMVANCTFSGNLAGGTGGGMLNYQSSSPTVTNCKFSGNSTGDSGGGMCNVTSSAPTVTNCTFSSNEAAVQGGGMFNSGSASPTIANCTFSGNLAAINGGGILLDSRTSSATVTNCILWGNSAPSGAQIYDYGTSSTIVSYSDVEGGWAGATNIAEDPLFKDADGADDILGTEDDDLRLSAYSPCIDAGDNDSVPADTTDLDGDGNTAEPIPFDLAGNGRFFDDPVTDDTGSGTPPIVDMGAYEFEDVCGDAEHPYPAGDVSGPMGVRDCRVDFYDFGVMAAHWLECSSPECD